jgi:hypothetical protein
MARREDSYEVAWERALGPTSRRLGCTVERAEEYVIATVQQLGRGDFVETVRQRTGWFDVYALYRDGHGWYVKIGETDNGLLVISHHEPERGSAMTISGTAVGVTEPNASPAKLRAI